MTEYLVYIIGRDGHYQNAIYLDCTDDEAAKQTVKQFRGRL
jgi:hypothetical protein